MFVHLLFRRFLQVLQGPTHNMRKLTPVDDLQRKDRGIFQWLVFNLISEREPDIFLGFCSEKTKF